jgi:hypothetical protein
MAKTSLRRLIERLSKISVRLTKISAPGVRTQGLQRHCENIIQGQVVSELAISNPPFDIVILVDMQHDSRGDRDGLRQSVDESILVLIDVLEDLGGGGHLVLSESICLTMIAGQRGCSR